MTIASFVHGLKALWVLACHDALMPKEITHYIGPFPRFLLSIFRFFFVKKSVKSLRPGQRLAMAYGQLGPAFIKLGQVLSTRGDIFGPQFVDDLRNLKDRLRPFSDQLARQEIENAFEKPIDSLFSYFGGSVGSASMAQVHEANLLDGQKVAVKILRPDIEKIVARDIAILRRLASLIEGVSPEAKRLEPVAFVETVADTLGLELDLRLEASAASELLQIMDKDSLMRAPSVVWALNAKRVLVMHWADGYALSDPQSLKLEGLRPKELADKLIQAFLTQALHHGVFHADLHEGNLFIEAPDKIIAVDFGIVGRLRPIERRYLASMLWGFLRRDYKQVAMSHFEAGYVPAHHNVDRFAQALRAVGEPVLGRKASEVSMGRLLTQLFEITAQFDMHLRPELILLQKTMVSVEGVARRICPDHDLWEAARPVVKAFIEKEMSPLAEARRVFDSLYERLLTTTPPPKDFSPALASLGLEIRSLKNTNLIMGLLWLLSLVMLSAWLLFFKP
jgi:ubiquinone biosynthesis protein